MTEGPRPAVAFAVTDHAVERWLQRVRGSLDPRAEIVARVAEGWAAGQVQEVDRGTVEVRAGRRPEIVFVCRHDRPRAELLVVTLWEAGEAPAVPRRFTDALAAPRRSR